MAYVSTFSAGQRLTADAANAASEIGMVVFRAYRSSSQSITSGTETVSNAIVWDAIDLDRHGAGAVSSSLWTAPFAGWWTLAGGVAFNGAASGTVRDALWYVNGALQAAGRARFAAASGSMPSAILTVEARTIPYLLSAGDTVQLVAAHDATGSQTTATGSFRCYMSVTYSGPS